MKSHYFVVVVEIKSLVENRIITKAEVILLLSHDGFCLFVGMYLWEREEVIWNFFEFYNTFFHLISHIGDANSYIHDLPCFLKRMNLNYKIYQIVSWIILINTAREHILRTWTTLGISEQFCTASERALHLTETFQPNFYSVL